MNISNWLSTALLNTTLRGAGFSPPSAVYLALYTSNPTPADTGKEVSGGGYSRMPITFTAPTLESGQQTVRNNTDVEFPVASADWGLITHVGLRTAAQGGNLLWSSAIPNPRTIQAGDRPKFLRDGTRVRFIK